MLDLQSLAIDPELVALAPGLRLGGLLFRGVAAGPAPPALAGQVAAVSARLARELALEQIALLPAVAGWRRVMKALGTDPARYRVSSERLLRRVVKGEGLPAVNVLVDVNNLWSVETGLPAGLYDAARLAPPLRFGAGRPGEAYQTLGGTRLETAGKPVLRDQAGPIGGPLTDSERAMTRPETRDALLVAFAPPGYPDANLHAALDLAGEYMVRYAGGVLSGRHVPCG